jgi:hypothetical protein
MKGTDVGQNKWAALAWSGIVELGMTDFIPDRDQKKRERLRISPDIRRG